MDNHFQNTMIKHVAYSAIMNGFRTFKCTIYIYIYEKLRNIKYDNFVFDVIFPKGDMCVYKTKIDITAVTMIQKYS